MLRSSNPIAGRTRCLDVTTVSAANVFSTCLQRATALTILDEDGKAVLHQKRSVEDDQAKAQG